MKSGHKSCGRFSITKETKMATAKNTTKAATTKVKTPAKAAPKKAALSQTDKAITKINAVIAKLNERKNKLVEEITAWRDKRAALKAAPQPAGAPVATKVKKTATVATKKAATPKKAASAKKAKPAAGKSVS